MTTLTLKRTTALVLTAAMAFFALLVSMPAHAQVMTTDTTSNSSSNLSDLGRLIILNNLFNGGVGFNTGLNSNVFGTTVGTNNLGNLIVLDSLFNGNDGLNLNLGLNGSGNTNLGNLVVLDALFNGGTSFGVGGNSVLYTVQSGDTLSRIAARFYGNASLYPIIANANGIVNPNVISVGQVLRIPSNVNTLGGSFLGGNLFGGFGTSNLGNLIILESLFGNNN